MASKKNAKERVTALIPSTSMDVKVFCSHQHLIPPKDLIPHPDNNNDHTEEQVDMMVKIIKANGWRKVVVVSERSNLMTAGHLRVRAAIKMGMEMVPVDIQSYKDRAAEVKDLTADNELGKLSEFNADRFALTAKELEQELSAEEFQDFIFDAEEFGLEEIPDLTEEDDDEDADKVPEAPKNPLTRKGDVWRMKTHKLMCGDSSSVKNIDALMGGEKAELMFTDPPYRMVTQGGTSGPIGAAKEKLNNSIRHLCDFDPSIFLSTFPRVFGKGTMNAYVFCNKDLLPDYLTWARDNGYSFNVLFWKKPNAMPVSCNHYHDVEYIVLFRKSATWNNAVPGVSYSKCLEYGRELSADHPTMKPVGLIVNELQISSSEQGIVFEPFSGSGSTLIACEKTGRRCYAMELDETYTDVAVQRWMDYTGEEAWLESTNQTWSEVMAERRGENGDS